MKPILSSIRLLLLTPLVVASFSIYADWGASSWVWFQRSGTILALAGAILGYRSIVRLGKDGVGGANPTFVKATVVSSTADGRLTVSYDEETTRLFREADLDRAAGYAGAFMAIAGTLIGGYGDLVGKLFK